MTPRAGLTRDRVVREAMAVIDEGGEPALTMRSLAERLGVRPMALYRHVRNRDDLLDAVADRLLGDLRADPDLADARARDWRDFLERLGHGVRAAAQSHPRVFPLVAGRPTAAPWLRPPLRSLDWVEDFLDALSSRGFDGASAAAAYRRFTSFLIGDLVLEVSAAAEPAAATSATAIAPAELADSYPTVARLATELVKREDREEFAEGLRGVIDTIAALRG